MKQNYFASIIMLAALLFSSTAFTQTTQTIKGAQQLKVAYMDVSPPIRDIHVFTDRKSTYEAKEIKNRFDNTKNRDDNSENFISDPVVQNYIKAVRSEGPTVERVYEGVSNAENQSVIGGRVTPPDTQGDVGPNHYVQMTNLLTKIFDLNTNALVLGPITNSTFWAGFIFDGIDFGARNDGDPIVLYDQFEDRWIVSQFETLHDYILIAVSQTGDPTGAYYRYAIAYPNFPDYPKFGIWNDAIYITTRDFGAGFIGSSVAGIQKTGLYDGTGANGFIISILNSVYSHDGILPADADGIIPPPAGTPHFSMFKPSGSHDYLYLAETTPDWNNPANSSMTISTVSVASYLSASGLVYQPNGRGLHAHTWALMYRLQYRNFGTHQTMVANHTVKATSAGPFGIRWYEFRAPLNTSTWTAYQQGTFLPEDGENRWMGSIAMNGNGDIALGYSLTSGSTFPSIRFTGQSAYNSGSGIMDLPETSIFAGTASLDGAFNRWGDYSMMSVDPTGDEKFWYTTEYALGAVNWADWATKIAEIKLNAPSDPAMIAVTPASLSFTVGINGTDSDLLNIANTGIEGAPDLIWSLSFAEPLPQPINFSTGDGLNNDLNLSSNLDEFYGKSADEIIAQKYAMAEEDKNRSEIPASRRAGGPDAFGYSYIDSDETGGPVFSWTDITISGTEIISNGDYDFSSFGGADDAYKQISLPFTFNFYGVGQSVVNVSSNGYLTFGAFGTDFSNDPMPNASDPNDIICPFWDDFDPSARGTIHYLSTPSQFIVQYTNMQRWNEPSTDITIQVILNDDGSILYQYLDMQGVLNSATIGIEDASASSGLQVAFNEAYVLNNLAVQITPPTPPCPWLSVSPESGIVPAGTSQDVTVSVDADGLDYGTYECELTITSNASNASQVIVPVTLVVAPCEAPTVTTKNITVELDADGNASIVALDILEPTTFTDLTSTANWLGFVGVFVDGDFVAGDVTALGDVKSTIDAGADEITLQPNFNTYYPDVYGDPILQGSTYIEEFGTLAGGASFSFTGTVTSNTLDPRYQAYAFIRIFDGAWQFLGEIDDPLVEGNDFSVQYNNTLPDAYIIQYGFTVEGTTGAYDDEASLGNAVVQGMSLNIAPYSSCGLESVVISQTEFDCSNIGLNDVTVTATDINGEVSTGTATVTVEDNEAPILVAISTPITLWPPNHKYETIDMSQLFVSVEDNCGELSMDDVYITSVSSDEVEDANGNGDGKTVNDIVINSDCNSVDLRKERSGNGNGRVYTIYLAVDDGNGNTGTASCQVHVPHNKGGIAIDDGMAYEVECGEKSSFIAVASEDIELKNYPNPFKANTTIEFSLIEANYTKLVVYNSLGIAVATLYDGMAEAEQVYKVEFNAIDLSGGVYFYHLQSGENVNVMKKMMLIK